MDRKKVLLLGFGGTISMVPGADNVLRPAKNIEEILSLAPELGRMANITLEQLHNLDSTNITPTHWTELAMHLSSVMMNYDGIIITHGTDTMSYTSTAISLALGRELKIPIVFTGSQLPLASFGTDGRFNLENSMKVLLSAIEYSVCEVMIVFSDRVIRASRSIKISESGFVAFGSPAFPLLAQITATGIIFNSLTNRIRSGSQMSEMVAEKKSELDLRPHFQRGILAVELVPGIEPSILRTVIRSGSCQGLLLKSLGAGNVPALDDYSILPVIEEAVKLKIPVLVSTKFVGGQTHMDIYEPGKLALDAGAIPTGDLTDVAAQVKFMWALAQGHHDRESLHRIINTSFVGEISE